jgi:hypothetical protein
MLAGDTLVGVHRLEQLEQHTRRERRHGHAGLETGRRNRDLWGKFD